MEDDQSLFVLALMEVNLNILKNKIHELFQLDFSKSN